MENKEFESRSQQKRAPKCVCVRVSADRFWYVIGRSPRVRNGNPLQYSCLENSMDRGTWQATVLEVTKESDMTECSTLIDAFYKKSLQNV